MTIVPGSSSDAPGAQVVLTPEPRVVLIRPATVLAVLGIAVLVGLLLVFVYLAWHVLTWILVAVILAAALNPAVEAFERRGLTRGYAASIVFALALLVMTGVGFGHPAVGRAGVRLRRRSSRLHRRPDGRTGLSGGSRTTTRSSIGYARRSMSRGPAEFSGSACPCSTSYGVS